MPVIDAAVSIPMQQASGSVQTRYNSARQVNGTNQYFEWTAAANSVTNRNLGFYGLVRWTSAPVAGTSYYVADFGNLTAGTGGNGRIRLVYDATNQQFVASTASTDGSSYREARSPVTSVVTSKYYFVGVSVTSTGDLRVIVNKTKTAATVGTIPSSSTVICNVFRIGSTARTTAAGMFASYHGTWSLWIGSVPTDDQLDQMADGVYPPNISGITPSSVWAMLESGTTETDRIGSRNLTANNSPTLATLSNAPFFYVGDGWATMPMQAATGAGTYEAPSSTPIEITGDIPLPMQAAAGAAAYSDPAAILLTGDFPNLMQTAEGSGTFVPAPASAAGNFAVPMQAATGVIENEGLFTVSGAVTAPMQAAAGTAQNAGLFSVSAALAIPMQTVSGTAAVVSGPLEAAGAFAVPMQLATGTVVRVSGVVATGAANIPMQVLAGASETRYNSARRLNGSTQYFSWTAPANAVSNRNLGYYGFFRMELAPAPNGAYYIADFGNLTAGTGGAGRIRLVYDAASKQFVASTANSDGSIYREARSPATTIDVQKYYFVGVSVASTGDVRVIVNKTKTTATVGTIPGAATNVCNVFRIGATARTTASGLFTGTVGTWSLFVGSVPTDDQLDMLADGIYPPNIPGLGASSVWAMVDTGATEGDRIDGRTLTAVSSPTPVSAPDFPAVYVGQGTATMPMQQAAGAAIYISANSYNASGGISVPMQTVSGQATAEPAGVRGNISIPVQVLGGAATRTVPLFSAVGTAITPMQGAGGVISTGVDQGTTFYVSTITNTSTGLSLVDQEVRVGLGCKLGDVPAGYIVQAFVNNSAVKTQLSRRRFWPDGSLKFAEASFLMPVLAAGATVNVEWRKSTGTWTAQDTGLHSGPTIIASNMTAEWRALTWTNRPTPTTLGANVGPLIFRTQDMLAGSNNQWIKTVYTGHLVTEWEASIYAKKSDNTFHPDFAAKLYIRAWGGTASTPKRIEFAFKSMYGWDDNAVPADAYGYQVSWDLSIGGTVIRGSSLGTTGWTDVKGFKGGSHFSLPASGKMDVFDVATQLRIDPPALVHKHKMDYLIDARLLPNIDLNNGFDNSALKKGNPYQPGTKGLMVAEMSDVGERDDITWGLTGWTARTMLAHNASVAIADTALHQQTSRTMALAVGAVPCQGYRRDTRGMVSHMPAERIPDARLLPTIVGAHPETANGPYTLFTTLDEAHFPNLSYFNYLTEGNHHILQLLYGEASAPATFTSPAYGKDTSVKRYDLPGEPNFPVADQVIRGQIRGIARHVLQIGVAAGMGHPDDLETIYYGRLLEDWCIASAQVPIEEDRFRTGTAHQDNFIYRSQNDPIYKSWMHTLVLHGLSAVYGLTRRSDVAERAGWWVNFPKTVLGGYNDGTDPDKRMQATLYTTDELYYTINFGDGNGTRKPFSIVKQWGTPIAVTYNADNTISIPSTTANHNGAVFTPFNSATPAGLVRGAKYYAVNVTGATANRGGTLKLSETIGGPAVNFGIAAPVAAQAIYRSDPTVIAAPLTDGINSGQNNGFGLQMIGALKHYYHNVAADPIVEKALNYIEPYKLTGGGGWVEKAKWAVTFEDVAPSLYQVFYNGDPVYAGADEVWSTIPTGTYNGNFNLPLMQAAGTIEFAPGLGGDTRGAVTIPMQTFAGAMTAPELVFTVSANANIPMQGIVATLLNEAPASDFVGAFAVPMQTTAGTAQFAPLFGFGNAIIPIQAVTGTATFVNPIVVLTGNATIPITHLAGEIFIGGVPIQGNVTIPMQSLSGEATSEQFEYEIQGDIVLDMVLAGGEALVDAFEMEGGIEIPMQAVNGLFETFVEGNVLAGGITIPMQQISTVLDNEEMEVRATGDFLIPSAILTGAATAQDFIRISGAVTIPMQQSVPTLPPVWMEVPRTRRELWTTITPA